MSKRQLFSLFFCSLVPWTVGNGLLPLLPIYAARLGASPTTSGNYLAFSYLAIALGAISSGWISDKFHKRRVPIIIAGLIGIPIAWLTGRATNIWILSILTALLWFCGGLGLGLINILAGLSAKKHERGKIFGILSLTTGLGGIIGGLASGSIVDRWGFQILFTVIAGFLVLWPICGFLLSEKKTIRSTENTKYETKRSKLGRNFNFLFSACLAASIAGFIIILIRSLRMDTLGFNATEISITGAVSGFVALPLPLLMGWQSDRQGRKLFLYLGYVTGFASLTILSISKSFWHFPIASAFQSIIMAVNGTVGNAFVTDILPKESLGRGLALIGATSWIGGVIGFAGAGFALQTFGTFPTLAISLCFPLTAILLLVPVRSTQIGIPSNRI